MNSVDAVFQQLGHGAATCPQKGLKRAYSTVHVSCPVALTCASVLAATNTRWKDKGRVDDGESKPVEGFLRETRQGCTKTPQPCLPGNGRNARR